VSAIRTWLRAQREASNRAAFAQLIAEHPLIPRPEPGSMDGQPYEIDPWHPLAHGVPTQIPMMTLPEAGDHLRRYMEECHIDAVALSGLPGGGRWWPPRS
jgi:hypothetical protein